MRYGVLSHQGDYIQHEKMLRKLRRPVKHVLTQEDMEEIDALFFPGGESTTIEKFFNRLNLWGYVHNRIIGGMPVFGTCAGIIILATEIANSNQRTLNVLDITVERNGHGRQIDSFESKIEIPAIGSKPVKGVFIRAPKILRTGDRVEVMAKLNGEAVAVRTGKIWAMTFHPELTDDTRIHKAFVEMVENGTVD